MNIIRWFCRSSALAAFLAAGTMAVADDPVEKSGDAVTYAMLDDPRIEFPPPVTVLPEDYVELWLRSLDSPDVEFQRQLALVMEKAHRLNYADFSSAVPVLRTLLRDSDSGPRVRVAAAMALLTLDDRESAQTILELTRTAGPALAQNAEPVLARWKYEPAIALWLKRLSDPQSRRSELRLAIECLQVADESDAVPGLRHIVLDPERSSTIRLAAARSWGAIQLSGLEETAQGLTSGRSSATIVDRLLAASLVRHHESSPAQDLLVEIAADPEPAVAAVAWQHLLELDSSLLLPIVEASLASSDARIRGYAARALDEHPTEDHLIMLAGLLNDPHPDVRNEARLALLRHAQDPQFDPIIRTEGVRWLHSEGWRGLEQAGMLLAALDHEDIAPNLLALLEHPRDEVALMAAWGLRVLAVPETLPAMFAYTQQLSDENAQLRSVFLLQCAHFFEAFGLMDFQQAEPLLRSFVSKDAPPPKEEYSRAAAIWALGFLHKGEPDQQLVRQLLGRLNDYANDDPESDFVRRISAITIGRMQAEAALPELRGYSPGKAPPIEEVDYACRWAIEQMTGDPVPDPEPQVIRSVDWFLTPLSE